MKKIVLVFTILFVAQSFIQSQSPTIQSIINQTNLDSFIYFVEELSGEVSTVIGGTPYTIVSRNKINRAMIRLQITLNKNLTAMV